MNAFLFLTGVLIFLVCFSWFKAAAISLYSNSIDKNSYNDNSEWLKLFKVFLVDWLVCLTGSIFSGVLLVTLFNLFH